MRNSRTSVINSKAASSTAVTTVSDTKAEEEKKEFEIEEEKKKGDAIAAPRLNIEFSGFRESDKPCKMEVYLHNTNLNID